VGNSLFWPTAFGYLIFSLFCVITMSSNSTKNQSHWHQSHYGRISSSCSEKGPICQADSTLERVIFITLIPYTVKINCRATNNDIQFVLPVSFREANTMVNYYKKASIYPLPLPIRSLIWLHVSANCTATCASFTPAHITPVEEVLKLWCSHTSSSGTSFHSVQSCYGCWWHWHHRWCSCEW
jgi:hypothetical protein